MDMFTTGYCFDDVLLIPKRSNIKSRDDVDLSVKLPKGISLQIPIVSSNMRDVTGIVMATTIGMLGGLPIMHRFDSYKNLVNDFDTVSRRLHGQQVAGASVGIKEEDKALVQDLVNVGCKIICVDVAHGDHDRVYDFVAYIHSKYPDTLIIAGNVVTETGAYYLWSAGADVIKIGVGPGCFGVGTRILMSNGMYKNIEDIKPGDRVINQFGKPKTVVNSFSTGIRKVAKIRNSIHFLDTYVTPDHNFFIGDLDSVSKETLQARGYSRILGKLAKTKPMSNKLKWQAIGKSTNIALLLPKNIEFEIDSDFSVPIIIRNGGNGFSVIKQKVDCVLRPSYDLGYVFGTFLGDGNALIANNGKTNVGAVHWYFGLNESEIAMKLAKCVKAVIGRDLVVKNHNSIINCNLYHKPFAEFLNTFGKKKHKHLPPELLVKNIDYLNGLIDGLVDSDGHIEAGGRICFTNTSVQLIELFNIATYLTKGIFPNNQKHQITSGNLCGSNIENFNQPYVCRINTTADKRVVDNYQISKLLEYTEECDEREVFDLTVDCDTHSFIANNAIVHNSICSTRINTGNGYPQLSALQNICNGLYPDRDGEYPRFIADGGIKNSGDCVKSLVFSDLVMIGNLFAGTDEAPGDIITHSDGGKVQKFKQYAGSSTHKLNHIEGVVALVPYKGSVVDIVRKLTEGIRSGCSYQGVSNLGDLKYNPEFVVISNAGLTESHPHSVIL